MNSTHLAHTIFHTAQLHLRAAIRTQLDFSQPFTDPHELYSRLLRHSRHYQNALTLLYTMVALEVRQQQPHSDSRRLARQRVKQFVKGLIQTEMERVNQREQEGEEEGEEEGEGEEGEEGEPMEEETSKNEDIVPPEEMKIVNARKALPEAKRQVRQPANQSTPRANVQAQVKTEDMSHFHSQSTRKEAANKEFVGLGSAGTAVDPLKLQSCDAIEQSCNYGHFIMGDRMESIKQMRKINEQVYVVVGWQCREGQFQPIDSLLHSECVNLYAPLELATFCSTLFKRLANHKALT